VKPAPFAYHRPISLDDAVRLLAELAPQDGRVLAGGQSLVPIMAFRLARPAHLIDINAVAGLDRLAVRDGALHIGARVRHADFHRPVGEDPLGRMLAAVVRHIAHYPIRLRGTFCGSLAHADPAAEWCVVAATLDAELVAVSAAGERRIGARDFFRGAMETALAPEELLTEARLPMLPDGTRFGFAEFSRRAGDYALAMALAALIIVAAAWMAWPRDPGLTTAAAALSVDEIETARERWVVVYVSGAVVHPGDWDSLTLGMCNVFPKEDSVNGQIVVNGTMFLIPGHQFICNEATTLTYKDGRVTKVEGGSEARILDRWLRSFHDDKMFVSSHIGFGLDARAGPPPIPNDIAGWESMNGNTILALGSNVGLPGGIGGVNDAKAHADLTTLGGDFLLDDQPIIRAGEFVYPGLQA